VRGLVVPFAAGYSRSEVDGIVDQAKTLGASGLVWARRAEDGTITSSIMKALGEDEVRRGARRLGHGTGRSAAAWRPASRTRRRSCSGSCDSMLARRPTA
jgi:aspartyl-tRNA synthetase